MCKMAIFFETEMAQELLNEGELDQPHGAGLYSVPKRLLIKHELLDASDFAPLISQDALPVIVHARYASSGMRGGENCQPFKVGETVFAHNGTISKETIPIPMLSLGDPDILNKMLARIQKSDSRLLAEILAGCSIDSADKRLEEFSTFNNFFFYSEVERKFLVKGTFQLICASKGVAKAIVVGDRIALEKAFLLEGTLVITDTGAIVRKRVQRVVENKTEEVFHPWLPQRVSQRCSSHGSEKPEKSAGVYGEETMLTGW